MHIGKSPNAASICAAGAPRTLLALPDDEIHVWVSSCKESIPHEVLRAYEALLTQAESARRDRFRFEADRQRFLITRALVRTVLSRYADMPPHKWQFQTNEFGKPSVAQVDTNLHFNLSHTAGLIVLALARTPDLGVDVENVLREAPLEVASSYFAASELADLHELGPSEQHMRFFALWTLKESYIKARGMGLSLPLDRFAFRMHQGKDISFETTCSIDLNPSAWQFWQWEMASSFLIALCSRAEMKTVMQRRTMPLLYEHELTTIVHARSNA